MEEVTENFTRLELDAFLDRVAERAPVPGGGAVAAMVGALSCALARMVTAYSITKKLSEADRERVEDLAGRLRITDELMRALITQDAEAYARLAEATTKRKAALPGSTPGSAREVEAEHGQTLAATEEEYQAALAGAIAVPLQIVGLAAQTLSLLSDLGPLANRFLLSDFGAAAVLSEAAASAAGFMVRVNAGSIADSDRRGKVLSDLEAMLDRCRARTDVLRHAAASRA